MSIDGIEDPHFDFAAGFDFVLQVYLLSLLLELLMDQLVLEIPIQLLDILSWRGGTSLRKLKASLMASFSLCLSQVMRNPAPWSSYSLGSIQKQLIIIHRQYFIAIPITTPTTASLPHPRPQDRPHS